MQRSKPIKTDVFSFTTIRATQLITPENKSLSFISHPDLNASAFASSFSADGEKKISELPELETIYTKSTIENQYLEDLKFGYWLDKKKDNIIGKSLTHQANLISVLDREKLLMLWDQLFYQLITRQSTGARQAIEKVIISQYVSSIVKSMLEECEIKEEVFKQMANPWIVIPTEVAELIQLNNIIPGCTPFGVKNLGVIVYRKVYQILKCYVPGEVSRIENVQAREYKERHTRNFIGSQTTTETLIESEVEHISDTATSERNELQTEVGRFMDRHQSFGFGGGVTASYGTKNNKISANLQADFASSNAISLSNTIAKDFAKEVTRKALERVLQRISRKRTSTITKEFEENNKHGFDNRRGDKPVVNIFRWVDKVYSNRLVNYGKRPVMEIMIPEPSKFYKYAEEFKLEKKEPTPPEEPTTPIGDEIKPFDLNGPKSVTRDNYTSYVSAYDATVDAPPKATISKNAIISPLVSWKKTTSFTHSYNESAGGGVQLEEGYEATTITGSVTFNSDSGWPSSKAHVRFQIGNQTVYSNPSINHGNNNLTESFSNLTLSPKISGVLSVQVSGFKVLTYGLNFTINLVLKSKRFENWQEDTYAALKAAYDAKVTAQQINEQNNETPVEEARSEATPEVKHPALNREIEETEIKRIAIEMMTNCLRFKLGQGFYTENDSCPDNKLNYRVNQSVAYGKYVEHAKFLEKAFDWSIMAYEFLPYYWANCCDRIDLLQEKEENDLLFRAFRMSGLCRLLLPFTRGYEEAVLYYFRTGDIINSSDLVVGDQDDLDISLLFDLNSKEGAVDGLWDIRIPTTHTIIQAENAKLDEGGLPCYQDELPPDEQVVTNIESSLDLLGRADVNEE